MTPSSFKDLINSGQKLFVSALIKPSSISNIGSSIFIVISPNSSPSNP